MPPDVPALAFNDGRTMPQIGFGLWEVPRDETARVVVEALEAGYRMVDGAALYGNEEGLGEGIRRSGLPREEVFVTTKVWNNRHGYDETLRAAEESLGRLRMDRVDLVLIHWPAPSRNLYVETWRALVRLREEGRATSIGVSNFEPEHLDRLIGETGVVPALNQIELHPELPQARLRQRNAELGIVTQSWTPLGQGRSFAHPVIRRISERTGRTPAQVILRWHLDLGCAVIPRSTNAKRLAENLEILDFRLEPEDLRNVEGLETGRRTGPNPMTFA